MLLWISENSQFFIQTQKTLFWKYGVAHLTTDHFRLGVSSKVSLRCHTQLEGVVLCEYHLWLNYVYDYNTFSSIYLLSTQTTFFTTLVNWHDGHKLAFTVHEKFFFYLIVTKYQLVTRCGCNIATEAFV